MLPAAHETFAATIASRLKAQRQLLAGRWLDRLQALVPVGPEEIFPTSTLLDHIPSLIEEIGKFLATSDTDIAANTFVVAKAQELGVLRHEQHASVHQLLKEYELLRGILESFVVEQAEQLHLSAAVTEVIGCIRRINQAVAVVMRTTVDMFVERYTATISEQTRRFEQFNRLVGHELRQPLGVLQTAVSLLQLPQAGADAHRRERAVNAIERNVTRLVELVATISKVAGLRDDDGLAVQSISLTAVAQETSRQLREAAEARGVNVRVTPDLPIVTVDVGRLELLLTNLISNAIKDSDPGKAERFIEISPVRSTGAECMFQVRDNGLGLNSEQLGNVFMPFYRGHVERDAELGIEGLGLGLGIVRDCADAIGASIAVDGAPGEGATFTITLPGRPRSRAQPRTAPK